MSRFWRSLAGILVAAVVFEICARVLFAVRPPLAVIDLQPYQMVAGFRRALSNNRLPQRRPDLWDGRAAERVARVVSEYLLG